MIFKHLEFNHDAENFFDAMGISTDVMNLCKERIFFTTFTNALNVFEFFDDEDDAPRNIKTVTGDFQKCIQMIEDPTEYEYTLMTFHNAHDLAMQTFKRYALRKDVEKGANSSKKAAMVGLLDILTELKMRNDDNEEVQKGILDGFTPKGLMQRIEYVKNSQGSFQVYLNMVSRYKRKNNPHNVDTDDPAVRDILNNLFNKSEDDDDE